MVKDFPVETRKQAAELGKKKFWPGKNCPHGHTSLYYVATGGCIKCNTERARDAQRIQRKALAARATGGPIDYNIKVHPDDIPAVRMLVEQLNAARGIETPPLGLTYIPKYDVSTPEGINEFYENNPQG